LGALIALVLALVVTGCTASTGKNVGRSSSSSAAASTSSSPTTSAPTTPKAPPAVLTFAPATGTADVNPKTPITVGIAGGTLTDVSVTSPQGVKVAGALAADKATWQATDVLGYGKTYIVDATGSNAVGDPVTQTSTFTTVAPKNLTMPYFNTTGGASMTDGATYGVGMVVSVHFDEEITDRKAAEQALVVQTVPPVAGSWYWLNSQNVHWRPQAYYASGTKVTVAANVYGVDVGNGLYGQADKSMSFTIGQSHVLIADDTTKQVQVFQDGALIKTMPTSMGKGGSQTIQGKTITFWTQSGTMTVLDKANPVLMDSETYGLPHAQGGYKENVYWATRITTDGVYLHSAPWSVWAQGNTNTSHGCLNLSPANAEWFYNWSVTGDVVQVKNTGGSPLQVWQNGDWGLPWDQWVAGSAIK
jgi:lipoprotein-anchoring transpeptidase ErfK/SrfK